MGHIRLGNLPKTRNWQQVVELVAGGGSVSDIAGQTATAAERGLAGAGDDRALVESFWLLTQLPLAARSDDYVNELRECGLRVQDAPSLMELIGAFSGAVDEKVDRAGARTDLGEMAQLAATETISSMVGERVPTLFGTTTEDVRSCLREFARPRNFSLLAKSFFGRLTNRYLSYFLSRTLSDHVGPGSRFENIEAHSQFNDALDVHCRQAARIVEEFAGGWFSKTNFEGGISREAAGRFAHVAAKKISSELRKRSGEDA